MKALVIIGTRPQIIKANILTKSLLDIGIEVELVYTGQHYSKELFTDLIEELGIMEAKYNLQVGSGDNKYQIRLGVTRLLPVIKEENPDCIITIGDSNPALVGSLGALLTDRILVHIEAGLRSNDLREPEEINRIYIDSLADLMFCSTEENYNNLSKEMSCGEVSITGDLLCDAWCYSNKYIENCLNQFSSQYADNEYYLFTLHRKSNAYVKDRFKQVMQIFSEEWDFPVVWPVHPGVILELKKNNIFDCLCKNKNLLLIPALNYFECQWLIKHSRAVITDSVGIQVETYLSRKPCVVIRDKIEHNYLEDIGWSIRVNLNAVNSHNFVYRLKLFYESERKPHNPLLFGDGNAAVLMANKIKEYLLK